MTNEIFNNGKLQDVSFGDLHFFCTLYQNLSLSETANRLGLSVSCASRVLKKLRLVFSDELFIRSTPCLIPTSYSRQLFPQVLALLGKAEQFCWKHDSFDPSTLTRTIRIGGVDNAIFAVMNEVVHAFFQIAPKASLDFVVLSDDLFTKLANGNLDCAIYPSTRSCPPGIKTQLLYPTGYSLCVRKGHPLIELFKKNGSIPRSELQNYRKIVISNKIKEEIAVFSLDEKTVFGDEIQDKALSVPYFLSVPTLLEVTDFTAILPTQTAIKLMALTQCFEAIPTECIECQKQSRKSFSTRLIWHESVDLDPAIQWLRGLFAQYAKAFYH